VGPTALGKGDVQANEPGAGPHAVAACGPDLARNAPAPAARPAYITAAHDKSADTDLSTVETYLATTEFEFAALLSK
jgi:hypothetical protein